MIHGCTDLDPNWVAVIPLSRENREIEARHIIRWCGLFSSITFNCALYIMLDENRLLTSLEFVLNCGKCLNLASDKFSMTVCNQHRILNKRRLSHTSWTQRKCESWRVWLCGGKKLSPHLRGHLTLDKARTCWCSLIWKGLTCDS